MRCSIGSVINFHWINNEFQSINKKEQKDGATTFSIMTLTITALRICHAPMSDMLCRLADVTFFNAMLNVIMLNAFMLNVVTPIRYSWRWKMELAWWWHNIQHNDTPHNDTQHIYTQHNDTQNNDTQHNYIQHNDTQNNDTLTELRYAVSSCWVSHFYCYAEGNYAKCQMSSCWMSLWQQVTSAIGYWFQSNLRIDIK